MTKSLKALLAAAVLVGASFGSAAYAQNIAVSNGEGDAEAESGDADASGDQSGAAASGDGVGGQVIGVVSAGDASVDATNLSRDVDVRTGDAEALNDLTVAADASALNIAVALNDGDAEATSGDADASGTQNANASSGDGVAGQVAGVVTSAGGSADLALANTSDEVEVTTGDAEFENQSANSITARAGTTNTAIPAIILP